MPEQYALDIYRGDSGHWQFTLFTDAAKTDPYDLTGATAKAEIRESPGSPVVCALQCVITLPNIVDVDLLSGDSHNLMVAAAKWDLQFTWSGPTAKVKTPIAGSVTVTPDITDSETGVAGLMVEPQTSAWEQRSAS